MSCATSRRSERSAADASSICGRRPRKRRTPERRAQRAALAIADPTAGLRRACWPRRRSPPTSPLSPATAALRPSGRRRWRRRSISSSSRGMKRGRRLRRRFGGPSPPRRSPAIAAHHADNPDLQGIGREPLRMALQPRLPKPAFATALQKLARVGELMLDGAFVRLPSHEIRLTPADEAHGLRSRRCLAAKRASARRGCATLPARPAATRPTFAGFSSAPPAWAAPTRSRTTISFCARPSGK